MPQFKKRHCSAVPHFKNPAVLQKKLLAWYWTAARDLPWRHTKDPYKIWVSEIMLQQTQVDTVIPYYEKWLKRFPTVQSVAESNLSEVMKYWAGLGYYRRARMIHAAAKKISESGGQFPGTAEELMEIPGIGRYTAGAIASIAFEEKVPVLDGNVIRILTRLTAFPEDIALPSTIRHLWELAESILPEKSFGDFNQALMELGATVCFPTNPQCGICPVSVLCVSKKFGTQTQFPVKRQKETLEKIKTAALILHANGKVLIQKQPEEGRWGGLWMFPFAKDRGILSKNFGIKSGALKRKLTVHHGFTKYQVRLDVYVHTLPPPISSPAKRGRIKVGAKDSASQWVSIKKLSTLPFPSPHQKIVAELLKND